MTLRAFAAVLAAALTACTGPVTDGPTAVVEAFNHSLRARDTGRALELLAPDVLIYEFGGQEASRDEYAADHMKGDMEFLAADDDVLVFTREHGNEQIVCAFNLGSRNASLDLGADVALAPVDGHGFTSTTEGSKIKLGPYGAWFGRFA